VPLLEISLLKFSSIPTGTSDKGKLGSAETISFNFFWQLV